MSCPCPDCGTDVDTPGNFLGLLLCAKCYQVAISKYGPAPRPFPIGTPVKRINSDYTMPGHIVSVFTKRKGQVRYVVEDDRGTLFIMSEKNLAVRQEGET